MTLRVLPQAKDEYDRETFQRLLDYIEELDEITHQNNANVEIGGDEDSGGRSPDLIMSSPDGTRYAVRVSDDPDEAAKIPSGYDPLASPETTTSATLVDIPGLSTTVTLTRTTEISAFMSFDLKSNGSPLVAGLAISIDGVDGLVYERYLSGTNDQGVGAIIFQSAPLVAGTYTVKGRFSRVSGAGTLEVSVADILAIGMQEGGTGGMTFTEIT